MNMSEPVAPESPEPPMWSVSPGSPESPGPPEAAPGAEPGQGETVEDLFDVLSSPLDDGDDLTAVLTRRPRAKLPSLTLVLAAIVVASAGFLVGALVGKHYGGSSSGNLAGAFGGLAARPRAPVAAPVPAQEPLPAAGLGCSAGATPRSARSSSSTAPPSTCRPPP